MDCLIKVMRHHLCILTNLSTCIALIYLQVFNSSISLIFRAVRENISRKSFEFFNALTSY